MIGRAWEQSRRTTHPHLAPSAARPTCPLLSACPSYQRVDFLPPPEDRAALGNRQLPPCLHTHLPPCPPLQLPPPSQSTPPCSPAHQLHLGPQAFQNPMCSLGLLLLGDGEEEDFKKKIDTQRARTHTHREQIINRGLLLEHQAAAQSSTPIQAPGAGVGGREGPPRQPSLGWRPTQRGLSIPTAALASPPSFNSNKHTLFSGAGSPETPSSTPPPDQGPGWAQIPSQASRCLPLPWKPGSRLGVSNYLGTGAASEGGGGGGERVR